MMIYDQQEQQQETRQGRIIAGVATGLYFLGLALLLWLVTFDTPPPVEEGEGILINFGNVAQAAPGADMQMNDEIAQARQVEQQTQAVKSPQEQLTQDFEEAPVVKEQAKKKVVKPKKEKKVTPNPKPSPQPPAEKPREVNRKALFPGRTVASTASSDGTGKGAGNQGDLAGKPEGDYDGTGTGNSAGKASLSGRSLAGNLPRPDYGARTEGRVMVEITVDQNGKVVAAAYRSVGSTTQNSTLVAAALRAAKNARFNVDEAAPPSQRGTITYDFRMQ